MRAELLLEVIQRLEILYLIYYPKSLREIVKFLSDRSSHFRNLIFEIKVTCNRNSNALKTATNPKEIFENAFVYSNAFKWIPIDDQSTSLPYPPAMVHSDILVAQLRPGQEIEARRVKFT